MRKMPFLILFLLQISDFSAKIVQTCRRYESKFILEGGFLAAKFDPMLIKIH